MTSEPLQRRIPLRAFVPNKNGLKCLRIRRTPEHNELAADLIEAVSELQRHHGNKIRAAQEGREERKIRRPDGRIGRAQLNVALRNGKVIHAQVMTRRHAYAKLAISPNVAHRHRFACCQSVGERMVCKYGENENVSAENVRAEIFKPLRIRVEREIEFARLQLLGEVGVERQKVHAAIGRIPENVCESVREIAEDALVDRTDAEHPRLSGRRKDVGRTSKHLFVAAQEPPHRCLELLGALRRTHAVRITVKEFVFKNRTQLRDRAACRRNADAARFGRVGEIERLDETRENANGLKVEVRKLRHLLRSRLF